MITLINCIAQSLAITLTVYFLGIIIERNIFGFLKALFLILICDLITFGVFEYLSIPLIALVLLFYLFYINKSIVQSFIVVLISIIIEFAVFMIISLILLLTPYKDFEIYKTSVLYNLVCGMIYVSSVLSLKKPLGYIGSHIKYGGFFQRVNNIVLNILILNLIVIFVGIFLIPIFNTLKQEMVSEIIYTSLLFIFIIFSISSIIIFRRFVAIEREKAEKDKELELTLAFQKSIQKMYDDIMNFKHDYINIYSTFQVYIRDGNIDGLKKYFEKNITPLQSQLNTQKFNVKSLIKIKNIPLQGIIYTAIIKAEKSGISITIDIQEQIDDIDMNIIDLCRIIGIFLNNAIEETENKENSFINICAFSKQKCIVFIIENSCSKDESIMSQINCSTKGEDRGRGLNIVKSIINKYSNVVNNTYIKNGRFVQELWVEARDNS